MVSTLAGDPLCRCRLQALTPAVMRAAICRWREEGVSVPKVSARWLLLGSAVSWAVAEGLLRLNPLAGMRGAPQPRRHHSLDEVRRLLAAAGEAVESAEYAFRCRSGSAACARAWPRMHCTTTTALTLALLVTGLIRHRLARNRRAKKPRISG